MMYSIPAWGMREGKDPSKAKLPEEGCVPSALWQTAGEQSCAMGQCNAELAPGPCQTWRTGAWAAQTLFSCHGAAIKMAQCFWKPLLPLSSVAFLLTPHCPCIVSMLAFYIKPLYPLPSLQNIETRIMYSWAGLLCNVETCFLGEAPVAHSQDELW